MRYFFLPILIGLALIFASLAALWWNTESKIWRTQELNMTIAGIITCMIPTLLFLLDCALIAKYFLL